jgi:putative sigma-54 modulation protein
MEVAMQLQLRGKDLHISDSIRTVADQRAERLDRLVDRVNDAKLELRLDKRRIGGDQVVAQFTLHSGKTLLRAEERHQDAERAVGLVMDRMERQARRLHERSTYRRNANKESVLEIPSDGAADEDDVEQAIVRTKRFSVKPMDPDEAAEQMSLLGHDFFLFLNTETSSVSLLYRRRDGKLGLLIPNVG